MSETPGSCMEEMLASATGRLPQQDGRDLLGACVSRWRSWGAVTELQGRGREWQGFQGSVEK